MDALPHNDDVEKGLLCSMQLDPSLVDKYSELPDTAFYDYGHQLIWSAFKELRANRESLDTPNVMEHMDSKDVFDKVDPDWMRHTLDVEIKGFVPTPANANYYLKWVTEYHNRRQVIMGCMKLANELMDAKPEVNVKQSLVAIFVASRQDFSVKTDKRKSVGISI